MSDRERELQYKVQDGEPTFDTYRRYSAQQRQEAEMLGGILRKELETHSRELTVLDIGAGDGPFVQLLTNQLKESQFPVRFSWLEPERAFVEQLQEIASALPRPLSASVVEGDWESYEPDRKFDAIILSHVLYYYPPRSFDFLFEKMVKTLSPGGVLLIVAREKGYEDYEFIRLFYPKATRKRLNEKTIEDAEKAIRQINWQRLTENRAELEITKRWARSHIVFPFESNESDAGKLVTFYLRIPWEEVEPELREEIRNWLLAPPRFGKLEEVDGILIVKNPNEEAALKNHERRNIFDIQYFPLSRVLTYFR